MNLYMYCFCREAKQDTDECTVEDIEMKGTVSAPLPTCMHSHLNVHLLKVVVVGGGGGGGGVLVTLAYM